MLTFLACLWQGTDLPKFSADRYGPVDVLALLRGLRRTLSEPWKLKLLVDEHYGTVVRATSLVRHPNLEIVDMEGHAIGGWTPMLEPFRPSLRQHGRCVLLSLDLILVNDPSWLARWDEAPVGLLEDPLAENEVCSVVCSYSPEGADLIWTAYRQEVERNGMADYLFHNVPCDMHLLRALYNANDWRPLPAYRGMLSYKAHVEARKMPWDHATMVYFHGDPKPCDLAPDSALAQLWRQP